MTSKLIDPGTVYHRLTVLHKLGTSKQGFLYDCECACGKRIIVLGVRLRNGHTKSCGCLLRDSSKVNIRKNRINNYLGPGAGALNYLYRRYKSQAELRNLSFNLTKDEFLEIVTRCCAYCGDLPRQKSKPSTRKNFIPRDEDILLYNGIDRVNNSKGYTVDNCVPCCKICNRAKRELSFAEFKEWVGRLIVYNERKNPIAVNGPICYSRPCG